MATLKQSAEDYTPQLMQNIADLEFVDVGVEFHKETRQKSDGEEYEVSFVRVNGKEYRTPNSVLEQIKEILKEKPNTTKVKVIRKGEGLKTSYSVIPLD